MRQKVITIIRSFGEVMLWKPTKRPFYFEDKLLSVDVNGVVIRQTKKSNGEVTRVVIDKLKIVSWGIIKIGVKRMKLSSNRLTACPRSSVSFYLLSWMAWSNKRVFSRCRVASSLMTQGRPCWSWSARMLTIYILTSSTKFDSTS